MQDTGFFKEFSLNLKGEIKTFAAPVIMGILNITPDSFFDGGKNETTSLALESATQMILAGAEILDVGGYSTRPSGSAVNSKDELSRTVPVIQKIKARFPEIILSVDTFRAEIAEKALENGADIINDISGGRFDKEMFKTASDFNAPLILMHSRGEISDIHSVYAYENVIRQVIFELSQRIHEAQLARVNDLIVDPGFGFSKNLEQNFSLFKHLEKFKILEKPILVGISRKSMIYKTLSSSAKEALNGTTVLNTLALNSGAQILRVHDVKEAVEAKQIISAINH